MCLERELSDFSESTEYSTTSHNLKALLLKAPICIDKKIASLSYLKKKKKIRISAPRVAQTLKDLLTMVKSL